MNLEEDLRRLSERVDADVRELEPTSKSRRRIKMRRVAVAAGAVVMVALFAVGAFALTDLGHRSFSPAGLQEDLGSGTYADVDWSYSTYGRCLMLEVGDAKRGCGFIGIGKHDMRVWDVTSRQPRDGFWTAQARISEKVADVKILSGEEEVGRVYLFQLPPNFAPGSRVALGFIDGTELGPDYPIMVAYDKDGKAIDQQRLAPEDAANPPLPLPPDDMRWHVPTDDYADLAQYNAPGIKNLFLQDATLEDVEHLRDVYMGSMEDAGWTLVREDDQARSLKTEYAMVQFWRNEDGIGAFSLEQLGFAKFDGYENLLKFSYGTCPPADSAWCGIGD